MWANPFTIVILSGLALATLIIVDWSTTGFLRRVLQARPPRKPQFIDLAADSIESFDDTKPTWLVLTNTQPAWNADDIAALCARVWQLPVNEHEHDTNFVIGEAPCLMLRHGDWHYLLTIGDEPYMDPEQIPATDDATLRAAFAAQQSWFSLSVVGTPDNEKMHGPAALSRSAQMLAVLANDIGLVVLGDGLDRPQRWTPALAAALQRGDYNAPS